MDYYIKSAKNHPSIIDAFLIIGYDSKDPNITSTTSSLTNVNQPYPTVLTEVPCFTKTKKIIHEQDIIRHIFPEPPPIYNVTINDRAEKIKDYNVTFSVLDDKMCIPHVTVYVYGYVFYEQVDSYYLPKCFCIVSLYPLYSFFRLLTRKIYLEFEKGNKNIPIEEFVVNVINFFRPPKTNPISIDFTSINDIQKSYSNSELHTLGEAIIDVKRNKTSTTLQNLIQPMDVKSLKLHEIGSSFKKFPL